MRLPAMSRRAPPATNTTLRASWHLLGLAAVALLSSCGARSGLLVEGDGGAATIAPSEDDADTGDVGDAEAPDGPPDTAIAEDDGSAMSADSNPGSRIDGATAPAAGDASAACMMVGGGGSFGAGGCEGSSGEMCGSTNYQIDCSCPRGSCICFGPTTHVVPYAGCPLCPGEPLAGQDTGMLAQAFALCGFPYPH
jgi:hypothetical protein